MDEEEAVRIKDLRVQFGRQIVLPQLSTVIPTGQIIGLLGPSGSGKTTLVKSIIGLNRLTSGSITVFGQTVPSLAAMAQIGYMAQNDALYDDLTARDNLLFFAEIYGLKRIPAGKLADELLNFVDLESDRHKAVRYFSGGMRRRLSLAIALINNPRLLILDEPTVGIDPVLRLKFWKEFNLLKAQGCTIIATTHVMDEAAKCDRLIMLRQGMIIASGTPEALLERTKASDLETAFLRFSAVDETAVN